MIKRNGNNGNHGVKGRSGRRPKAYTEFKRRIESERIEDADYAFWLHVKAMRDETNDLQLRLDCADWVANRVLGKPTQPIGQDPKLPFTDNTITVFVHDNRAA